MSGGKSSGGRPKRERPARYITLYISEDIAAWLSEAAEADGTPKSRLAETLLRKERERREAEGGADGLA
tara:strand:+ start:768 stop:974 length:207 start_codon:yes stop_codon:yes gene_type:complete